ncbi:MAG: hypothetical protein E7093_06670 [Bacteroidales bacterium]|nr:hypothetical protein [Bacteroidales bacterium]
MKNLFKFIFLSLMTVAMVACNDSDDYNPDTAVTPYEPVPGRRMVSQVKTTNTIDGRNYSWEHNFSYDAQGRIKEVNSSIVHYRPVPFENKVRFYKCYITSKANYYFEGKSFRVEYSISKEYPDYPSWNGVESGRDRGRFNSNGTLAKMSSMDFEYSATQLQCAYSDGGYVYKPVRDSFGNVTGYTVLGMMNSESDTVVLDRSRDFLYSGIKNKTNFDFSGYFGYWGIEKGLMTLATEYYAPYQLTAFGMIGATSSYLPLRMIVRDSKGNVVNDAYGDRYHNGMWEFDEKECPVSFVDGSGRKTEIKYVN